MYEYPQWLGDVLPTVGGLFGAGGAWSWRAFLERQRTRRMAREELSKIQPKLKSAYERIEHLAKEESGDPPTVGADFKRYADRIQFLTDKLEMALELSEKSTQQAVRAKECADILFHLARFVDNFKVNDPATSSVPGQRTYNDLSEAIDSAVLLSSSLEAFESLSEIMGYSISDLKDLKERQKLAAESLKDMKVFKQSKFKDRPLPLLTQTPNLSPRARR